MAAQDEPKSIKHGVQKMIKNRRFQDGHDAISGLARRNELWVILLGGGEMLLGQAGGAKEARCRPKSAKKRLLRRRLRCERGKMQAMKMQERQDTCEEDAEEQVQKHLTRLNPPSFGGGRRIATPGGLTAARPLFV